MHANGPRKAAEVALDQVEAGGGALGEIRPFFFADHEHDAGFEQHADAVGRDARQIEHDLDRVLGLEHIDAGHAFARDHVPPIRPAPRQVVEQPVNIVGQIGRVKLHGTRRDARHRSILRFLRFLKFLRVPEVPEL